MAKLVYFNDPEKYYKLISNPAVNIRCSESVSENMMAVSYTTEDDFVEAMGNTNVVIAAFTTAQARLRLYEHIEKLGERVLYFDTGNKLIIFNLFIFINYRLSSDSVIYIAHTDREEYQVPIGSYLGDMTDELNDYGAGSYITEFASGGPKNYGFIVKAGTDGKKHELVKVKGFPLDYATSRQIRFNTLRKIVKDYVLHKNWRTIKVVEHRIGRQADQNIVTQTTSKNYRVVYDKRVVKRNIVFLAITCLFDGLVILKLEIQKHTSYIFLVSLLLAEILYRTVKTCSPYKSFIIHKIDITYTHCFYVNGNFKGKIKKQKTHNGNTKIGYSDLLKVHHSVMYTKCSVKYHKFDKRKIGEKSLYTINPLHNLPFICREI